MQRLWSNVAWHWAHWSRAIVSETSFGKFDLCWQDVLCRIRAEHSDRQLLPFSCVLSETVELRRHISASPRGFMAAPWASFFGGGGRTDLSIVINVITHLAWWRLVLIFHSEGARHRDKFSVSTTLSCMWWNHYFWSSPETEKYLI